MNYISRIVELVTEAQEIAAKHGFKNLLQPGLVKELIVADILGHDVHKTKHEPDAYDPQNPDLKYEYLSCFEGGTFQLDRMFRSPADKRAKSLERITRNHKIYCAVFEEESPLTILVIYEPIFRYPSNGVVSGGDSPIRSQICCWTGRNFGKWTSS